jgi:hypothetical protein
MELDEIFSDVAVEISRNEVTVELANNDDRPWKHILKMNVLIGGNDTFLKDMCDKIIRILDVFDCEHMSQFMDSYSINEDEKYLCYTSGRMDMVCIGFDFRNKRRSYCTVLGFVNALNSATVNIFDRFSIDEIIVSIPSNRLKLHINLMGEMKYDGKYQLEHNDRVINYQNLKRYVITGAAQEWAHDYKIKKLTFDDTLDDLFVGLHLRNYIKGNSTDMNAGSIYITQERVLEHNFTYGDFFTYNSYAYSNGSEYNNMIVKSHIVRAEGYRELYMFEIKMENTGFYKWVYLDIDHVNGFEMTKFALHKMFGDGKTVDNVIGKIKKRLFRK